jgi:RNA polymerase sigma-70 factor (ECF subfamily)
MARVESAEKFLVERIRQGDELAWQALIEHFEGRLLAYFRPRVQDRSVAEDLVQETFLGLLLSLPNYDPERPLEQYLFSIAAHKLTDYLRRVRIRPDLLPRQAEAPDGLSAVAGRDRRGSSIAISKERKAWEAKILVQALREIVGHYRRHGFWEKLRCVELLVVRGWPNKRVAEVLGISEQTVANYKFEFLQKLRSAIGGRALPAEVFPELATVQS